MDHPAAARGARQGHPSGSTDRDTTAASRGHTTSKGGHDAATPDPAAGADRDTATAAAQGAAATSKGGNATADPAAPHPACTLDPRCPIQTQAPKLC